MRKIIALLLTVLLTACAGAGAETHDFKVTAPTGAPGIALATLAAENPDQYTFITPETLSAEFASATADFIVAPINAGAKLYKAGKSDYRLAAVLSWGNLFIASQRDGFTLEDINGADITLFGEDTINASIALYAMEQNGITPGNVEYLAGAANTQSLLVTDAEAIVVTAEPALTAAKMKNEGITAYAVNDLFKAVTGYDGYAQAGLFVNAETLSARPGDVADFLNEVQASCDKCETDVATVASAAVALELLPSEAVAEAAIPGCAIRYAGATEAREQVEATANIDLAQFGGALPEDGFYYAAQ